MSVKTEPQTGDLVPPKNTRTVEVELNFRGRRPAMPIHDPQTTPVLQMSDNRNTTPVEKWQADLNDVADRIRRLESSIQSRETEIRELRTARSKLVAKRLRLQKVGGIF